MTPTDYRRYDDIVEWALEHPQHAHRHPLSDVLQVNLSAYDNGTHTEIVIGHVLSLLESTADDYGVPIAALLAVDDWNRRSSPQLDLSSVANCSFYMTMDIAGAYPSAVALAKWWQQAVLFYNESQHLRPIVVAGADSSLSTAVLAILGQTATHLSADDPLQVASNASFDQEGVLTISPTATSQSLNDFTLLARTIPTNHGDAEALCTYLASIGTSHLAMVYVNDEYGKAYMLNVRAVAGDYGMTVHLFPFADGDQASISSAADQLAASRVRHVFGVWNYATWSQVATILAEAGVLGNPSYAWFLADALEALINNDDSRTLVAQPLASAMNMTSVLTLQPPDGRFFVHQKSMAAAMNQSAFVEYLSSRCLFDLADPVPWFPSIFSLLGYEAIMAIGHAACGLDFEHLTAPYLLERLKVIEYQGASGHVAFDAHGTREPSDMIYRLSNVILEPTASPGVYLTKGRVALEIQTTLATPITVVHPLLFASGLTTPPPNIQAPKVNLNLVPLGVQCFVWILAAGVILLAAYCAAWTVRQRNQSKIRASQPVFLILCCLGPVLVATTVILSTLQEPIPNSVLNWACMAHPWFLALGFSLTFAALFAKTWRINRVYANARKFRRVQVRARHVLWPLVVLLGLNVTILTVWTVRAPLEWNRRVTATGALGEPLATTGGCFRPPSEGGTNETWVYLGLVVAINIAALLVTNYESFRARHLPTEFNESYYVAMTNVILLEDLLIGLPVLFVVGKQPTVVVLVMGVLVTIFGMAVLLPMFVPKFFVSGDRRHVGASDGTERTAADSSGPVTVSRGILLTLSEKARRKRQTSLEPALERVEPVLEETAAAAALSTIPEVHNPDGVSEVDDDDDLRRRRRCVSFAAVVESSD